MFMTKRVMQQITDVTHLFSIPPSQLVRRRILILGNDTLDWTITQPCLLVDKTFLLIHTVSSPRLTGHPQETAQFARYLESGAASGPDDHAPINLCCQRTSGPLKNQRQLFTYRPLCVKIWPQ